MREVGGSGLAACERSNIHNVSTDVEEAAQEVGTDWERLGLTEAAGTPEAEGFNWDGLGLDWDFWSTDAAPSRRGQPSKFRPS
jgi:hypothetical protein